MGYFDTEDAAARAYDRAAIGLLGRQNCRTILNFPIEEYDNDSVPELVGKCHHHVPPIADLPFITFCPPVNSLLVLFDLAGSPRYQ